MPKTAQTPASVLAALMGEYQLNPFSLARELKLSPAFVRQLVLGKSRITAPTALRLGRLFGNDAVFWLDLQQAADLTEASGDKELMAVVKEIAKAKKPAVQPKIQAKPGKKPALSDKRKKAAKVPGAKPVSRKPNK